MKRRPESLRSPDIFILALDYCRNGTPWAISIDSIDFSQRLKDEVTIKSTKSLQRHSIVTTSWNFIPNLVWADQAPSPSVSKPTKHQNIKKRAVRDTARLVANCVIALSKFLGTICRRRSRRTFLFQADASAAIWCCLHDYHDCGRYGQAEWSIMINPVLRKSYEYSRFC